MARSPVTKDHGKLRYLDFSHVLRARGSECEGTAADFRFHLMDAHGMTAISANNVRLLARQHLLAHALMASVKQP